MGGYNRPVRRFFLSGYNRPVYRVRGLGDAALALTPFDLNNWEVEDFFSRHPDIEALTTQFDAQVTARGYNSQTQSQGTNWFNVLIGDAPGTNYVIPAWGISVPDSSYGNVVIFPDANGILHYSGGVTASVAQAINQPPYIAPSGNPQSINDLLAALQAALQNAGQTISGTLPWVIGAGVLLLAISIGGRR